MIIAIDGHAGAGKGSLGRALAAHFNLPYLDTGIMYRHVAYECLKSGVSLELAQEIIACVRNVQFDFINVEKLRDPKVAEAASCVASLALVRSFISDKIREFTSLHKNGVVLDGRDIGTIILPNADVKLFLTASLEERANRRLLELSSAGHDISFSEVFSQIKERDLRDEGRDCSPLKAAADAYVIDTTLMTFDEVLSCAINYIGSLKA